MGELTELGTLTRHQIVTLVGVASLNRAIVGPFGADASPGVAGPCCT